MKNIMKEINNGKNLEMNIPKYGNYMAGIYYKGAVIETAMNYYTFYECVVEDEKDDEVLSYVKKINNIISDYVIPCKVDEEREKAVSEISDLRKSIYINMDELTAIADLFAIYEHVLNRCEYLFKANDIMKGYNDEDFTREIMQYIFSNEDNSSINGKISEIIAELPVRLTKQKFFGLLNEGIGVYNKTDKETVDDFMYILKSSATLKTPLQSEIFPELIEIMNDIKKVNYSEITKDDFKRVEDKLLFAGDYITKTIDRYMMLQEIINRVYVMIINAPYADSDAETKKCMDIIASINKAFSENEFITLEDSITDMFVEIEGKPEVILGKISSSEYVLDTIKKDDMSLLGSIMVDKMFNGLFISQKLMSDSLFVDISSNEDVENTAQNDNFDLEEYIENNRNELTSQLTKLFSENQKMVNKAVMSSVLSKLPVFFNNVSEIQEYVFNSLNNCTNNVEKSAVVELVKNIMSANSRG